MMMAIQIPIMIFGLVFTALFNRMINGRMKQTANTNHASPPPWLGHGPQNQIMGLFGNIAVPDHHQLAVEKIRPDQTKPKQQFTQVVKLTRSYVHCTDRAQMKNGRPE